MDSWTPGGRMQAHIHTHTHVHTEFLHIVQQFHSQTVVQGTGNETGLASYPGCCAGDWE